MDNPTSTGLGEKNTSPMLHTPAQQPVDDDDDELHLASGSWSQPPMRSKRRRGRGSWLKFCRGYGAALVMGLPVLPVVVSAITIVIYLSISSTSGWVSIVSGAVSTYIAWLLVSLLFIPLTSPRNANSRSYGLLESRFQQLQTRLYTVRNDHPDETKLPEYKQIALNEAYDKLQEISENIDDSDTRLSWAMGYGYVNAWGMLHRAEEALVEVEPEEVTMRGAMHDKMAISNSQMSNRDELLAKLRYAAKKLDPAIVGLFKPLAVPAPSGDDESPAVQQLEKEVQQIADHIGLKLGKDNDASSSSDGTPDKTPDGKKSPEEMKDEARARLTLREVRRSLNDYRDHLWEGLLRARNNLLGVTFVTGLGTHILLCIAILALPLNAASHTTIIAAASYYMLGAIAGLFGRIGQATLTNVAVDDYGLTLAQVMSKPLYSGLAGLGGVLLSSTVLTLNTSSSVQNVFTSVRVDYLIVAAAFGLTPNLIAGGLQNQSNKLLSALRASKTTISDKTVSNDDGQISGD
jgi:hypothetical protein